MVNKKSIYGYIISAFFIISILMLSEGANKWVTTLILILYISRIAWIVHKHWGFIKTVYDTTYLSVKTGEFWKKKNNDTRKK